jgi:hypothetical protein
LAFSRLLHIYNRHTIKVDTDSFALSKYLIDTKVQQGQVGNAAQVLPHK